METTSEEILLDTAIEALRNIPSLVVVVDRTHYGDALGYRADAHVCIKTVSAPEHQPYQVEVKGRLTPKSLEAVLEQYQRGRLLGRNLLLVTQHASEALIDRLLDEEVEFADAAGNMFLAGPGYYVLVRGRSLPRSPVPVRRAFTATDLRVIYALLAFPELRRGTYRDIRDVLGVGLASVSRTLNSLLARGYLVRGHNDALYIVRYDDLLYRWELGYLEVLRARLEPTPWRFTNLGKEDVLALLRDHVDVHNDVLVGGEEAASILTGRLKPQTLTLHVPASLWRTLRIALRVLPAQENTDLYVLRPLTPQDRYRPTSGENGLPLMHPVLVRAELLALGGDRLRETATVLLDEVIRPEFADG